MRLPGVDSRKITARETVLNRRFTGKVVSAGPCFPAMTENETVLYSCLLDYNHARAVIPHIAQESQECHESLRRYYCYLGGPPVNDPRAAMLCGLL